jgi:ADP-heptose:LPS heptosyltransferase
MTAGAAGRETTAEGRDVFFIRLRLLGDIVFTIPAVDLFHRTFPHDRIHYVVEDRLADVAALIPGIHRVITLPRKIGLSDLASFRRQARGRAADLVVDFHSGPTSALLTRSTGAAIRVGYRTPNRNWAYTRLVPRFLGDTPSHSVVNQTRLLEAVGVPASELPPLPQLTADRFPLADEELAHFAGRKLVAIHIGAGNRFRDWGETRFSDLIGRLLADGLSVGLIGNAPAEVERGARLKQRFPLICDWTGRLDVTAMLARIGRAAAYVGADSGPLHLASLTATPLVALYGPNLPAISGPWRQQAVTILEKPLACRPCSQHRCRYGTMPCMSQIDVETVYAAVVRYLI